MKTSETSRKPKRELIVQAAAQVFAQKGFSGTVMAEIAVQAGVGKGTLYEYFDSKEDLFFAVFEWFSKQSSASATVSISALGGSASDRLEVLSDSIMRSWTEMKDFFSLAMEFWAASASSLMRERFKEALRQCYEDFRRIVSALIRDGIERGEFRPDVDPEATAAALVGAWDALFLQAWFDEAFDPQAMAKKFMTVLIRGLVSKEHPER